MSLDDKNPAYFNFFDTSKPREERDFKEIYPDLDEEQPLKVFILEESETSNNEEIGNKRIISDLKQPVFTKKTRLSLNEMGIKFPKVLHEYGFKEPGKYSNSNDLSYKKPFKLNNNETIQSIIEKKEKLVEYDMDEQDLIYLQNRNNNENNIIKLKPEIFEIMITILENEWLKLELQLSNLNLNSNLSSNNLLTLDDDNNNDKYGNDDGIIQGYYASDQKCAVCNDSDCDSNNAIVFCDGCDIAVHQECYGIAFIPEGEWLCRKCMINTNHKSIECCFCPSKTGAFKQLDNSLWGHVICALWINELYFANPIYMEPIEGIDFIPKNRWKLICYICKQKIGACIQCSNKNCFQAYHVSCAKRSGIYMNMTKGIQGALTNKTSLKSYCDKHSPPFHDSKLVIEGINKTRHFFRDLKILNDENDKLTKNQKFLNKLNNFKWKTENNTPIPPKKFSDILFQKLISLRVEDSTNNNFLISNFFKSSLPQNKKLLDLGYKPNRSKESIWIEIRNICNEICKYWCLKREFRNGSSLIRKNNNLISISSILYGDNNDLNQINEKLNFSEIILNDLNKLIELTNLKLNHQYLENDINNLDLKNFDTCYFPLKNLINITLTSILKKIDNHKFLQNYKFKLNNSTITIPEILNKNESYEYESIDSLMKDIESYQHQLLKENKSTTNIVKLANKLSKEINLQLPSLKLIEDKLQNEVRLKIPYVKLDGLKFSFTEKNEKSLLDSMDLSEVDTEDETNDGNFNKIDNEKLFKQFLYG